MMLGTTTCDDHGKFTITWGEGDMWMGRTGEFKVTETKCCGDFDNETYRGVYICYNCIKNVQTRNIFLSQYDKSTEARTK